MPQLFQTSDGKWMEMGQMEAYEKRLKGEIGEPPAGTGNVSVEETQVSFICDVCDKVCKSKLGLLAHKRSHK